MVGALVMVLVALVVTTVTARWIWTRADAITPVSLPAPNASPPETLSPSVKPSRTPRPRGRVLGSNLVAVNTDTMPLMSSAWQEGIEVTGVYGGAAIYMEVHKDYKGTFDWANYVGFGQLDPAVKYASTPAGLRAAAATMGGRTVANLYPNNPAPYQVAHRPITVNGHRGHEITARVPVREPGLKETFSFILIAVIDRGDGTAAVSVGAVAGSTPAWVGVWRTKVSQIQINR